MGYEYQGDPAASRSMTLNARYPGDQRTVRAVDDGGMWLVAYDPEGMEVEVTVTGVTPDVITAHLEAGREIQSQGVQLATLRRELEEERAARRKLGAEHLEFRRAVVEKALEMSEAESWCDDMYRVLGELGLTEADGVPPETRTVSVRVDAFTVNVEVARGEVLDSDAVGSAVAEWAEARLSSGDWYEA